MDGVTKRGERVMTVAGVVIGILAAVFMFQRVIGDRMVEVGRFTMAVFIGGLVGMGAYILVKDGIGFVLKRAAGRTGAIETNAEPAVAPVEESVRVVEPDADDADEADAAEDEAEDEFAPPAPVKAQKVRRPGQRPQLRATLPPEDDEEEEIEPDVPARRQRPLRPQD